VRYHAAALAAILAVALAVPAQAAECCDQACNVTCKTLVLKAEDDGKLVTLDECDGAKVITIKKDGEKKVIKLKDGQVFDVDDKLDAGTRLKLLDAKIALLRATGQLKTDLAIKRAEVEILELAKKPDAEILAKKKEINALKAQLEDAKLEHEQTVKKLVPEGDYEWYILGSGCDTDLLEMTLGLPLGLGKRIKRIELRDDGEDSD